MTYQGLSVQGKNKIEYREWEGWPDIDVPVPLGIDTAYVRFSVRPTGKHVMVVVTPEGVREI